MRVETKSYNIYAFDELDEKIKEKLLEKYTENEFEFYCETQLEEDMSEYAKELLKKYFGQNATFKSVCYDLSYCQGRGAMIEFDLTYYGCILTIRNRGHYMHELSFEINEHNKDLGEKRYNYLKEKIYDMNCELKKFGDNILEDRNMFKEMAEEFLIYNCEFLEDGTIYK